MKRIVNNGIVYSFDEEADLLYISFSPGEKATTSVLLTDSILLRLNRTERRPVGITLLNLSLVVQDTEFGPPSFPLTGLDDLEPEWQEMVIEMLKKPPVSDVLKVSTFSPSLNNRMPIVWVDLPILQAA